MDRFEKSHRGRGVERALVFIAGLALAAVVAMSAAAYIGDQFAKANMALAVATGG